MALKVYVDRMSQPSRAVLIFCKINGIDFEEIRVDILTNKQFSPEYKAINPMRQVPAIVDGRFKLFESHAILIYLCCAFPGVASHWYPGDLFKRSKIHSVLDWHHSNLRRGTVGLVFNTIIGPLNGLPSNAQAAKEGEKLLVRSLAKLEDFWLKDGRFLTGSLQPSIADISLVCEIMQLELLSEKDRDRILSPYKKVVQWIEDTKKATAPHFDEVHGILFKAQKKFRERMATESVKNEVKSKM
ncbi:putative glutathione transferase [Helianthus annuus]|uniref:glutathione transferase n=1 Tax=Helianthus annuus TaxID=4232 RepID=A0A0N9HMQ5_HELAN|nr:glutathione S-transferase T1 [Helianthus annuus]ALG05154.1 glutathione S-transferase [Helianthus annuus]KAF5772411.1 putative glutathione transferase [Helianthus annuus]KAJ0476031.1 putative glutathione transferase [Helianthus annuus]KAJ0496835.1 putative glutathione transferase [Helianthus annuus]KAJ0662864.1 putative glutathione transferase [Helianthus annuus]